jgi:hypothetical protein
MWGPRANYHFVYVAQKGVPHCCTAQFSAGSSLTPNVTHLLVPADHVDPAPLIGRAGTVA